VIQGRFDSFCDPSPQGGEETMSGNTTEVECGDLQSIEELLPNGYDDLRAAGCEESGCAGEAFALIQFDDGVEIVCKICLTDRQNQHDLSDVRVFRLDDESC